MIDDERNPSALALRSLMAIDDLDVLEHIVAQYFSKVETVDVRQLVFGDTPRSGGEQPCHTALLMECGVPLPPILVHRPSMRIVDGVHRVRAAQARGICTLQAIMLDGSWESVFVVAVAANRGLGLPLSLRDRRNAAARILLSHAQWSDRSIASLSGLSAMTVRAMRSTSTVLADAPALESRTGRDGRVRPVDAATGRRAAAAYLEAHPGSSLRTVAKQVGVSPNTVRDVRMRVARGEDPVPMPVKAGERSSRPGDATSPSRAPAPSVERVTSGPVRPLLASLSRDPAVRMTASGRELLRWLHRHSIDDVDDLSKLFAAIPSHRLGHVAEIAYRCALNWSAIGDQLARTTADPS